MYEDVIEIARKAGDILKSYHGKTIDVRNKGTDFYSPVSTADLESNEYICAELKKRYAHQILSEESENQDIDFSKPVWIIDPLDGTIEFLKGREDFCVMIGLYENSQITFGVVYAPIQDRLFFAQKGKGAWIIEKDRKKAMKVTDIEKIEDATSVVCSARQPDMLDHLLGNGKCARTIIGSVGIRICEVAAGNADFYVCTTTPAKWDTAAAHIILTEAGGSITDFSRKELDYSKDGFKWDRSFVASNKLLHDEIYSKLPSEALELAKRKNI